MTYAAAAGIAAFTLACGRGGTEENLREALEQANIRDVAVAVDEHRHIVHLTGRVETLAERTRAEEVAAAAVGTTGQVVSDLSVAGVDVNAAGDEQIIAALDRMVDADPILRERDVHFDVTQGEVTVTGAVRSVLEKNRVSEVVRGTAGVNHLSNELEIADHP
jgi:osmotically-inducible protein OsmY